MELSFLELRAKEVVNTQDGRKLGKVCDVVLCYPENRWLGLVAPGNRSFGLKKNSVFIDLRHIVKIGEDVILVDIGLPRKTPPKKGGFPPSAGNVGGMGGSTERISSRNFEEYE